MKKSMKRTFKILALLGLLTGLLLGLVTTTYAAGNTITKAKAKTIAVKAAGVKKADVKKWIKVKLDNWDDDGVKEWDVEFKTSTYFYEVEVNSRTGKVEDFDQQKIQSTDITKAKAKEIALETAGEPKTAVKKWVKVVNKGDEWDLKFQTENYEYDVEISALTGRVKDFDRKKIASSSSSKNTITKAEAKSIALEDAKNRASVSGNPNFITIKLDYDDGLQVYEIEFRYGMQEFEYEVDAKTGKIISWDIDYDD